MKDILKGIAESNGFGFDFGRSDFHGLFDELENKDKVYVFLDPFDWVRNENDMGDLESITFTGSLTLGLSSSIDEISYEGRYDDYIKSLALPALEVLKESFKCGYNTQFATPKYFMVINYTNYNFDGIVVDYTVTIDKDRLTVPNELGLELEAKTGGTVEPYEGLNNYPPLSKVAINAVANDGYSFQWWLINGAKVLDKLTIVTINQYKKAVAYFIGFFTLNISSIGNGSTNPISGSYEYEEGTDVRVEAFPDENNQFDNFNVNGVVSYENPIQIIMSGARDLIANFSLALQTIQNVFGTTPVDQQFVDQSGDGNSVIYKNVQVGYTDGVGSYVETNIIPDTQTTWKFSLRTDKDDAVQFIGCGDTSDNNAFFVRFETDLLLFYYGDKAVNVGLALGNGYIDFEYESNGTDATLKANGTQIASITGANPSGMFRSLWYGARNNSGSNGFGELYLKYGEIQTQTQHQILNFQDGDDSICIDTSGNSNDAVFMGGILSDFRGTYINGIDSVLINNGYSRFQQIADPTKYIYAAYTDAGVPTKTSIVGYEAPIEIPKNIISDLGILYDGVQVAGIETDATFSDINSLENSDTIEITKDANTVSNLKIKA